MGKLEKLLPQNIEAESGVLGSIIIDPEAVDRVIGYLRPEDFYRDAHRQLYEAIAGLKARGIEADFITLCDDLERRNRLEGIGGASYITSLMNGVPTSGNIEYYGRIVQRTGVLRRLVGACGQIAALAYDGDQEVQQILEEAERTVFEISQDFLLSTSTDIGMGPLISQYMSTLEQRYENRGEVVGIPTGYEDLDRLLGGLQRSDLDILAARTSIGKTALALNIAYNAAVRNGRSVGIFSLEMSREQLAQRFMALESGLEQQKLRTGRILDEEWEPLVNAAGKLSELGERGIRIDDTAGISLLQMRSRARRWIAEYGIELIIVDYLQLATTGENRKYENRQNEVSAISRGLKLMARELNVPVLALAQLSRALETRQSKVPQLSDLRESGSIENDADVVMFIYRDEIYNPETERRGQADIIVAKQRNGPLGEVALAFNQSSSRFLDLDAAITPDGEITFAREDDDPLRPDVEDEELEDEGPEIRL
ncbi:MAG TPA: replicative DNA helicase [Ktedonosporobacter sp.]|nr:replicative DNA helicase [Ktedonosporobacter sp.]